MKEFFANFKMRKKSDPVIYILVIFLSILGLVMTVSANMTASSNSYRYLVITTIKEAMFLIGGYILMTFFSNKFSFKFMRDKIMLLNIVGVFALVATMFYPEVFGARAWLRFSVAKISFTIQPSEFQKVLNILLIATFLGDINDQSRKSGQEIIRPIVLLVIIEFLIILILQKDLGSGVVLVLINFIIFLIPKHYKLTKYQLLLFLLLFVGSGAALFLMSNKGIEFIIKTNILKPYQIARFTDFINPFINITSSGYQLAGSLVAFSRGGLFGVGLGKSIQKYGYLPAASTDFILPLIGEELGFMFVALVLLAYVLLIGYLMYYALRVGRGKDKVVLVGAASYIFIHLFLNVGGVSAFIPLTGVPLLLLSSGGSQMLATMIIIGISQNIISKYNERKTYANSRG